ncbi:MAG: hypothetical protein ACXWCU_05125 [Caldimonas sp.]
MALRLLRRAGSARSLLAAPFVAVVAASALSACAAPAAEAAPGAVRMRVLVKLVRPSEDSAASAAEATRRAGVPASYVASVSAAWHALSLSCADQAACDAAVVRLRQASDAYEAVEPDARKHRTVM